MTRKSSAEDLIRTESELMDSGLELQSQCLKLLLAEMQALALLVPAVGPTPANDSETEAEFDNMPV